MKWLAFVAILLGGVALTVFLLLGRPTAEASPGATVTVNSTADTNTRDGVLTLREAMLLATGVLVVGTLDRSECDQVSNSTYGPPCSTTDVIGAACADTMVFDTSVFPTGAPATISLGAALPTISLKAALPTLSTSDDTVDGSSAGVIVDGVSTRFDCFDITSNNNTIKGLEIYNCDIGIYLHSGAKNNIIGGNTSGERNVISGNASDGVRISGSGTDGNSVKGNYIGTNAAGTAALPNMLGVYILGGKNNIIGGSTSGERNVISGNAIDGVRISGSGTDGNSVQGNYIGTNAAGTAAVPNLVGVRISAGPQNNTIGGSTSGERNVISGNNIGVWILESGTDGNSVQGNYIGTNAAGTAAVRNDFGVWFWRGGQNNTIGGSGPGQGNVISGNQVGVWISQSGSDGNSVQGNCIGTNAAGTAAIPNGSSGVQITAGAKNNTIGGSTSGERNVISGNGEGVAIGGSGTEGNVVKGNHIGTNAAGTAAIPNGSSGVQITAGAKNNTIGGSEPGEANVIAFNRGTGVVVGGG